MIEQHVRSRIVDRLLERVESGMERSTELDQPVLVSVSQEIDPVDPLRLFAGAADSASERWFWQHPDCDLAFAGVGAAWFSAPDSQRRFAGIDRVHREISERAIIDAVGTAAHPGIRAMVAFGFDPDRPRDKDIWRGFPPALLLVPSVMLLRQGNRHSLIFNVQVNYRNSSDAKAAEIEALYEQTMSALEKRHTPGPPSVDITETPADRAIAERFRSNVALASGAIRDGEFGKVVLARYRDIESTSDFDIPAAIDRLRVDYPACCTFAIARQGSVFLGASPEQLIKRNGKQVRADSLAGSIKRGMTPEEDAELASRLQKSDKDRHEHEICALAIREALEPLCSALDVADEPELLSFSNVHHLHTPISGTLSNGTTLIDLVERLHPTPAVGGYPTDVARAFLRDHEGFDRGWYAAPIGWLDAHGNGEFMVALRSAIVSGRRARLFAGCGIVGESDPDQELAESEIKLRPMLSALGGTPS